MREIALILMVLLCPMAAAASPDDSAVELWLRGTHDVRSGERAAWIGLIGVTIAFDRLNAPTLPLPEPSAVPTSFAQDAAPVPEPVKKQEVAAPGSSAWRLSNALIQAAVRAALRSYGATARADRLDSLRARSRASAALPELRLGAGRSTDQSVRLSPTVTDPYRYTQAGGADLWVEARVSWKLDRLLFAREEITVERLVRDQDQAKWKRVREVIDALFAWQKALIEASDVGLSADQQLLAELKAARAAAEVDALTGGWFWGKLGESPEQPTGDH